MESGRSSIVTGTASSPRRPQASSQVRDRCEAAEGIRTLDLLHGKRRAEVAKIVQFSAAQSRFAELSVETRLHRFRLDYRGFGWIRAQRGVLCPIPTTRDAGDAGAIGAPGQRSVPPPAEEVGDGVDSAAGCG